ncbi:4'-phosphopantetheinyl transferase superfamily protein [Wenzhouxiangella sp. AB-CW3]|uniref:4'-phosphopantetheinyl transferase family protein n=1 Tax=Wenzhouxiangella sp. AB-CW3 TaxID=2771012 RepID=UPI00168A877B|nr:4'-phosphopantetheinyl transferase superfamily protein [Wenzhouxiangella sp. AB-CW3]QOC23207.1 4'-phosphopantetheinyl transferase superfamily protein [Wenzhouxiangella sp. AB-CW3]
MMTPTPVRMPLPRQSPPPPSTVDLWLVPLADLPLEPLPPESDPSAHVRALRFRQQFMLRLLLGSYLDCPGRDVEVVRSGRGKPALGARHAGSALHFNLSHSRQWLAVALAVGVDVGVDIEYERSMPRAQSVARRYFPAAEAEALAAWDEPFRSRSFLQYWTAREALVKARGCGLAGVMDQIQLAGSPPRVCAVPDQWPDAGRWSLIMPLVCGGLIAHVAVAGEGFEVRTRRVEMPKAP